MPGVGVRPGAGPGQEAEGGVAGQRRRSGAIPAGSAAREGLVPRGGGPFVLLRCRSPRSQGRRFRQMVGRPPRSHVDQVIRGPKSPGPRLHKQEAPPKRGRRQALPTTACTCEKRLDRRG